MQREGGGREGGEALLALHDVEREGGRQADSCLVPSKRSIPPTSRALRLRSCLLQGPSKSGGAARTHSSRVLHQADIDMYILRGISSAWQTLSSEWTDRRRARVRAKGGQKAIGVTAGHWEPVAALAPGRRAGEGGRGRARRRLPKFLD